MDCSNFLLGESFTRTHRLNSCLEYSANTLGIDLKGEFLSVVRGSVSSGKVYSIMLNTPISRTNDSI